MGWLDNLDSLTPRQTCRSHCASAVRCFQSYVSNRSPADTLHCRAYANPFLSILRPKATGPLSLRVGIPLTSFVLSFLKCYGAQRASVGSVGVQLYFDIRVLQYQRIFAYCIAIWITFSWVARPQVQFLGTVLSVSRIFDTLVADYILGTMTMGQWELFNGRSTWRAIETCTITNLLLIVRKWMVRLNYITDNCSDLCHERNVMKNMSHEKRIRKQNTYKSGDSCRFWKQSR